MSNRSLVKAFVAALLLMGTSASFAQRPTGEIGKTTPELVGTEQPKELEGIGIDQKSGAQLDLSMRFRDENGADVSLGQYFDGKTPVIISPVYFACPGLCNFHLNGLTDGLKGMDWSVGTKFKILAVSFDANETPELAKQKKATYMKLYDRPGTEGGWHFLTGTTENIKKLTDATGFKFKWNEADKQWAHASAAIVTSPTGILTRYLPGIMFEPKDIRLAILEAGEGKVGSFVDQLVLYCFHYNPHQSRYTVQVFNIMKLGGLVVMLLLAIWLLPVWIRSRREETAQGVRK